MTIIIKDSFNRADDTTTLGIAETGQTWKYDSSTWGISTNEAYPVSTTNTSFYSYAFIESGISDAVVQVKLSSLVRVMVLLFRYADLNNLWFVRTNGNKNGYEIYKRVSGSWTLKGSFAGAAVGDTVKVSANGSVIKVYINDVEKASITDNSHITNTKHGIGKQDDIGTATVAKFDDFIIEDFNTGSTGNSYTKSLSDAISFSETFTKIASSKKALTDSMATSETFSKSVSRFKSLSDAMSTADTISKQLSVAIIDTVSPGDSENDKTNKSLSDTISGTDALSKRLIKAIQDGINTGDQLLQSGGNIANLSDYVTITDTIRKALIKYQSDSVTTSEIDSERVTKQLVDSLTQSDNLTMTKGKAVVLSDSVTVVDSLSKAVHRLQVDSVLADDQFSKQSEVSVRLYDVVVTTDGIDIFNPNAPTIIGSIRLKGHRVLNVILVGKSEQSIILKGQRIQNVLLKGSVGMTAENQNFSLTAGDTFEPVFPTTEVKYNPETKQLEEKPVDFTGCTVKWGLRSSKYATESIVVKTLMDGITILGDSLLIKLAPADTANLAGTQYHECEITDQLGHVSTIFRGQVDIKRSGV